MNDLKQGTNIDKFRFARIVSSKLQDKGYNIRIDHIVCIINILFDEVAKELLAGKKILINNFGSIKLKKMIPRLYFNFKTAKVEKSVGNKLLRFILNDNLRLKLLDSLDIEQTFEDKNEKTK